MGILSRLFGTNKPIETEFPAEGNTGSAMIKGQRIIYKEKGVAWSNEVNLSGLQYVYLVADQNISLIISDGYQHYIPLDYKGFREVYQFLSAKFGFDDEVFFNYLSKKEPYKKQLWRKINIQNYEILDKKDNNDYALGFEIQSPEKEFIDWDTTYDVLEQLPGFHFQATPDGIKTAESKYPVRLGNIILRNLYFNFGVARTDVPVKNFYILCYNEDNDDGSYKTIKDRLIKDLGKSKSYYERSDQNYYHFDVQGMWLSLSYNYDSKYGFSSGYTHLSIENHRDYPALLENSAEEEKMQIDQVILLDITIKTPSDYKNDPAIKKRPVKLDIAYAGQTVIWKDVLHKKIGFADQDYAQTFALEDIKSFSIENMLPAKGGGEAYLNIQLHNRNTNICILRGADPHSIDWLAERLTELSGKTVTFQPEYYNC